MEQIKTKKLKLKTKTQSLKLLALSLSFALCILSFTFSYAEEKIIAIVNSEVITQKDLDEFGTFMYMQMQQDTTALEAERRIRQMAPQLLQKIIEDRLILQEAKKKNLKVDESRVKQRIDQLKSDYPTETDFQNSLVQQGMAQRDLEENIREQFLMYMVIEQEVRSKIKISPTEVTNYFKAHEGEFKQAEEWEFRTISSENKSLIDEISKKLKRGDSLEAVAEANVLPLTKLRAKKNGELRKDVEDVIFSLIKGQSSDPINIQNKYYIFRLEGMVPPKEVGLKDVQDDIYSDLMGKKMGESLLGWISDLKKRSYIKILDN